MLFLNEWSQEGLTMCQENCEFLKKESECLNQPRYQDCGGFTALWVSALKRNVRASVVDGYCKVPEAPTCVKKFELKGQACMDNIELCLKPHDEALPWRHECDLMAEKQEWADEALPRCNKVCERMQAQREVIDYAAHQDCGGNAGGYVSHLKEAMTPEAIAYYCTFPCVETGKNFTGPECEVNSNACMKPYQSAFQWYYQCLQMAEKQEWTDEEALPWCKQVCEGLEKMEGLPDYPSMQGCGKPDGAFPFTKEKEMICSLPQTP